jgi:hypothetical protein
MKNLISKRETYLIAGFGGFFLIVVIALLLSGDDEPAGPQWSEEENQAAMEKYRQENNIPEEKDPPPAKKPTKQRNRTMENLALRMAQKLVKKQLVAPGTAEFPGLFESANHVRQVGKGRFQIHSWVDAQNGFGASIRTNYSCVMVTPDGETWQMESLQMQ